MTVEEFKQMKAAAEYERQERSEKILTLAKAKFLEAAATFLTMLATGSMIAIGLYTAHLIHEATK